MLRFDLGLSLPFTPDAPVPVSSYAHARGVTLLEMMMSLVILAGVVGGVVAMVDRATEDTKAAVTALHLRTVGDAANNYIKKNYAAIRAAADDPTNAGKSILIRISDMIADGHLSSGYAAKNPRGQDTCALVVKVGGKLASIVVTEGGDTIDNLTLGQIAATIGGAGGGIYSDAATTVRGAMGGWSVGTATFPAANHLGMACDGVTAGTVTLAAGHPAMALWLNEANEMTGLLHRNAMGDGTLNTMETPILLGAGATQAENGVCTENGAVGRNNNGAVLSCQGGTWKRQGSAYWEDAVADKATLDALPCGINEQGQTRLIQTPTARATIPNAPPVIYSCDGTGWSPLSIDDDGNMAVPMDITAGGGISASDGTAAVGYVALTEDGTVENTSCDIGGDGSVAEDIGTISRNTTGVILSCQDNGAGGATWKKAMGGGGDAYTHIVSTFGLDETIWPESIICESSGYMYRFFFAGTTSSGDIQYSSGGGAGAIVSPATRQFTTAWGGCSGSLDTLIASGRTTL